MISTPPCYGSQMQSGAFAGANFLGAIAEIAGRLGQDQARVRGFGSPEIEALGDAVLSATSRTDLAEAIDEQSAHIDEAFASVRLNRGAREVSKLALTDLDASSLERVLGVAATNTCRRGFRALVDFLELLSGMSPAGFTPPSDGEGLDEEWEVTFDSLIRNQQVPIPLRRGILKVAHSLVAMLTIARAEERGTKLEPWLALGLAEHFADGFVDTLESVRKFNAVARDRKRVEAMMRPHLEAFARYLGYANYLRAGGVPQNLVDDSTV